MRTPARKVLVGPEQATSRGGFALVIVLALIAVMVVLVVYFAMMTQVETQTASATARHLEARQNALLGMEVAIGQLQRYAGKDQAATFPATTYYPSKDVTAGTGELFDGGTDFPNGYRDFAQTSSERSYLTQVETYLTPSEREDWDEALREYWNNSGDPRNPHWTGVMDTALRVDRFSNPNNPVDLAAQIYENDPDTLHGEPKRDQLPLWLISGNEQYHDSGVFDPTTATSYPSDYVTPATTLGDPETDNSVVYLVGEGSATDETNSADGLDGRVKAPKQELVEEDGNGGEDVTGHYAYWVADESIKANFAIRDPYFDAAEDTVDYRNRLQTPQRIGWENITGFDDATFELNDDRLQNVNTSAEISLLEETNTEEVEQATKENFHSLTAFSESLLTDTARGGLKKDLSVFMETMNGLNRLDTIADPNDYDSNDPRFDAWNAVVSDGLTNTGFPTAAGSLNNIPVWEQLRDWYNNIAVGDTITPDADTAPVLTYIMFHDGFSYDGDTQTIRYHWLPCIVLWNPYDVGMESATYEVEIGIAPQSWRFMLVKENPTLAELQSWDPGANWQGDEDPLVDADGDGNLTNDWRYTDTDGNVRVILRPDDAVSAATGLSIPGPDTIDMSNGPWPQDNDVTDGTSDAFGRYFYYFEVADSDFWGTHVTGEPGSVLANKQIALKHNHLNPDRNHPVDYPMKFSITTDFGPGEVRIFTMGTAPLNASDLTNWDPTDPDAEPVRLVNEIDVDAPASFYFDAFAVTNGPASAEAEDLKFFTGTNLAPSIYAPTARFTIGGEVIMEASDQLGTMDYNDIAYRKMGDDYRTRGSYGDFGDEDADGDGTINRREGIPKFVTHWRPIYDFENFTDNMNTQAPDTTTSSIHAAGTTYLEPMTGSGGTTQSATHNYLPVLSRFNLGAKSFDPHPLVDALRSRFGGNNRDEYGQTEGMTQLFYVTSIENQNQKWDDNQYADAANGLGYALIKARNDPSDQTYAPLSTMPIRVARRPGSEILSLGQFQQVNLSPHFWQPSFPIGNSDAAPYTDREAIAGINSRPVGKSNNNGPVTRVPNDVDNQMLDMSYLLNEVLWDRYYLSTIPQSGSVDFDDPLPNSRHRFTRDAETSASSSELSGTGEAFDIASAYLTNVGALNVNSTSVEAWKALLTAFRDLQLGPSASTRNPDETVPVSRTLDPIQDKVDFVFDLNSSGDLTVGDMDFTDFGNASSGKDYSKVMGGFRYLTDGMIEVLAERIVDEVRLRGPFLSLADFVNRRLVAPQGSGDSGSDWYAARTHGRVGTETANGGDRGFADNQVDFMNPTYEPFIGLQGINGAIARAINVSGVNGGVNHPSMGDNGLGGGYEDDRVFSVRIKNAGDADYQGMNSWQQHDNNGIGGNANRRDKHTNDPAHRSHVDSEHLAGAATGEAGQLFAGAPGFVTQGDLLAMIGPALTPRGDTFLIRSYGDVVNPATGEVESQVWLEAVVQRVAEPVTPAGTTGENQWRPTDRFGRKFEVVNFRWLTPDEV